MKHCATEWFRRLPGAIFAALIVLQSGCWAQNNLKPLFQRADALRKQGRYEEAEKLFESMVRDESLNGPNREEVLGELAGVQQFMGKYSDAESNYQAAISLAESIHGVDSIEVADDLDNLGSLYLDEEKNAQAKEPLERALNIRKKKLKPDAIELACSYTNLSTIYVWEKNYALAESSLKKAIAIEQKPNADTGALSTSLDNLGFLYNQQHKFQLAEPLYRRALAIKEKSLGLTHPELVPTLDNLAYLCQELGKYDEAERLYKRSIAIQAKSNKSNREQRITTLKLYESLLMQMKRPLDKENISKQIRQLTTK